MFGLFKTKNPFEILEKQRKDFLKIQLPEQIRSNFKQPIANKDITFDQLSLLVLDFETTGGEPSQDHIISMGWVEVHQKQIDLALKKHFYLNNSEQINHQTAVVNQIVPEMLEQGSSLDKAMTSLFSHCQNRVLVVHGKVIEKGFIDYYMQQKYGVSELPLLWIDTMKIEVWLANKLGGNTLSQDNRLTAVRKRYQLPQYNAHNALVDSLATAELLLAQIARIYRNKPVTLETLYKISQ